MSDVVRDFINFYDGFVVATEGKKPNDAQWKLFCERVEKMRATAAPPAGAKPANLKAVPSEPAVDPRFVPETLPKGQAMSAGPR